MILLRVSCVRHIFVHLSRSDCDTLIHLLDDRIVVNSGMKQLIGKLNDLWPEHSVALSIPKEIDASKEKIVGVDEIEGKFY